MFPKISLGVQNLSVPLACQSSPFFVSLLLLKEISLPLLLRLATSSGQERGKELGTRVVVQTAMIAVKIKSEPNTKV